MNIGIIGDGHVGSSLAAGLQHAGHHIQFGTTNPNQPVNKAAAFGDVVILAVPYTAIPDVLAHMCAEVQDKTLIDVTNPISSTGDLAIGCTTSDAEEIQRQLPKTHVVKAFNTVFAPNQRTGHIDTTQLTAFIAGNHTKAKTITAHLARDLGFRPIDCGDLSAARYLEPMAMLIINLAYGLNYGTHIGFVLTGLPKEKQQPSSATSEQFLTI